MNDQQFRQLLNSLGLSWEGYRKVRKGVKKRISRHMQHVGYRTIDEYCMALDASQELRKESELLMTVSISRFFRDHRLWEVIEMQVLPAIIQETRGDIKVWSAGCGCGEEVYSLKIVWDKLQRSFEGVPRLTILATDMNPVYLDRARAGVYSRSSLKEIPEEVKSTYFELPSKGHLYTVSPCLKEGVVWKVHNLSSDPPGTDFQLIFLRNNLLTYYEDALKVPAFLKVIHSLTPGGFLVIGAHEKLPPGTSDLLSLGHPCIFQRHRHTE
ncbi:MAG: CheR family methyltransferase [Candidatus Hodarchaeota archaeon]